MKWEKLIIRQRESGLHAQAFCLAHRIPYTSFISARTRSLDRIRAAKTNGK